MSRVYASIQGSKGEATRQGTPKSGISGHIRGWNLGVRVRIDVNKEGIDVVQIALTSGSNNKKHMKLIGKFTEEDLK